MAVAERVEQILDLLSRLGRGDSAAFFQKGDPLGRYEWHYGLTFSGSRGVRAELMFTKELPEEDEWEYRAVRFLMSLVPHRINRLPRCAYDGCKRWFYAAKRWDQQFCTDKPCRQHYYDSNPEVREHKRKYMRKRYAAQKERDRKLEERLKRKARKSLR